MKTTIQAETLDQVLPELKPLLALHYEEVAWRKDKIPLNPDIPAYYRLESAGVLKIYTARRGGVLVGYSLWIVSRNLHYSILMARNDIFFVEPGSRGAAVSSMLHRFSETELKAAGAVVMIYHIKRSHNWMKLAERWGFEDIEHDAMKWIGD